jgi:hypothetical protein
VIGVWETGWGDVRDKTNSWREREEERTVAGGRGLLLRCPATRVPSFQTVQTNMSVKERVKIVQSSLAGRSERKEEERNGREARVFLDNHTTPSLHPEK